MPKVEVTLECMDDINFEVKETFDYDDEEWGDMSRDEREAAIKEDAEGLIADKIGWDYKVKP